MEQDDKAHHMLCDWHSDIKRAKKFHYRRQGRLEWWDRLFGISVILLSLVASVLAFWPGKTNTLLVYGASLSGLFASALATIQLLGNFKNEAVQNYNSAKEYNVLQAEIEEALYAPSKTVSDFVVAFRHEWGCVDKHAPYIPDSYYPPDSPRKGESKKDNQGGRGNQ
jgi:hypothetical protein